MPDADEAAPAADKVENAATALLGGQMAGNMPDVDLSTVSNHQQSAEPLKSAEKQQEPSTAKPSPAASTPALVDSQGRTFNPLLHETDANGQPVLRKGTNIIKCRRVPLKEAREESRVQLPQDEPAEQSTQEQDKPEAAVDPAKRAAMHLAGATTIAGLQVQLMRMALGEHTAHEAADREMLVEQWQTVFQHYNMGAVHPLVGLAVVSGAVAIKAINRPEGQGRWLRIKQWTRLQIGWLLFKLTGRRPAETEPSTN